MDGRDDIPRPTLVRRPLRRGHRATLVSAISRRLAAPSASLRHAGSAYGHSFTDIWRRLALAAGLPGPHRPEDRARVRRVATQPTLFTLAPTHHGNMSRLLEWAAEHRFGSLLLHCPVWAASDATYAPQLKHWPEGWDELHAVCYRARALGLTIGLHTMTTSVADGDPLVTPVPDRRLLSLWSSTLRRGIDAQETSIPLDDAIDGLSRRHDYMSFGRVFRIGNELIVYADLDSESNTLLDCQRGAYGTRAVAHARGETAHYLFRLYNEFAVDPESDLVTEVGENLARAFQATGAEMIYFDDSEAVPDPYLGHISGYHAALWRAIGLPHLHVQASSTGGFGQYLLARVGQQDTALDKRALLDQHILPLAPRYQAGDLVPDFGWFGIVYGDFDRTHTSRDDIDALMARMLGSEAGVTIFGKPELIGSNLFSRLSRRIADWRTARIPEEVIARMRTPGTEFRLRQDIATEVQPWRGRLFADEQGTLIIPLEHHSDSEPLSLRLTLLPPLVEPGSVENIPLYAPSRDTALPLLPSAAVESTQWRWSISDPEQDFARWRVVFSTPLDLSAHRAPAIRFQVEGEA